ncbi:MAG: LysE family translocator [Pseudomonadota bacterium]
MIAFIAACFLLIITPGPGVLSVAGVGSGFGFKKGSRYLWGLCLGNAMVAVLVASGIAAAVFSVPYLREFLLVISTCYFIYLAAKIALAGSKIGFLSSETAPGLRDGIALQAINPKAYVANSLLFSGFTFLPGDIITETLIKFVLWTAIWIPVHFGWLLLGVTLRRMNLPAHIQRIINFIMAGAMLCVVALAVFVRQ